MILKRLIHCISIIIIIIISIVKNNNVLACIDDKSYMFNFLVF